jgi:HEAT repeat protein
LNSIQSPESINCLLAGLDDVDEEVRDWSIRALRDMDDTRALEKLSEALLRSPPAEQVRMIRLIVERRSDVILRAIVTLLDSESTAVRRVAAWAMGVSPYPPAVPSLRALLDDADEEVRSYAKVALIRSGGIDPSDLQI